MREILFRGKRVDNGEWVYGNYAYTDEPNIKYFIFQNYPFEYEVDPKTVGQYTGFTDVDGNIIFEGDIVAFIDCTSTESGYCEEYCFGEVLWIQEEASFCVTNRLMAESYEVLSDCRVIGNIHDNPELLD